MELTCHLDCEPLASYIKIGAGAYRNWRKYEIVRLIGQRLKGKSLEKFSPFKLMIEFPSQQSSVNNTGSRIDYALQSLGWRRSSLGRRLMEELGHEILHLLAVLAQAPSQL